MNKNIIDWNTFEYIFSGNERVNFESLSYNLFCYEFNLPYGIFRFYNQVGIETNPINYNEQVIGFQAKYYDPATTLASKKNELKNSITKSKEKYPEITEIIFYTNKEFGQGRGQNKPAYQKEIEDYGLSLDISVEWRSRSYFEAMLIKPELKYIFQYYFVAENGFHQCLNKVMKNTNSILDNIVTSIKYDDEDIKFDVTPLDLRNHIKNNEILCIYGQGGSGKSALIKDLFSERLNQCPFFIFKPIDLTRVMLPYFANYPIIDLLSAFKNDEEKFLIIDSAEKLFVLDEQEFIIKIINEAVLEGWKVIFTVRSVYKDNLTKYTFSQFDILEFEVTGLSIDQLKSIFVNLSLSLPEDENLLMFLCNLFHLKTYLNLSLNDFDTLEMFRQNIWDIKICNKTNIKENMHVRRNNVVLKVARSIAENGTYYYESEDDHEVFSELTTDEIIVLNDVSSSYNFTHDVYEEWALVRLISESYKQDNNPEVFFKSLGTSLTIRKTFRVWLNETSLKNDDETRLFITNTLSSNGILAMWRDELLISLLSWNGKIEMLTVIEDLLDENDYELLMRSVFLLNMACRKIDESKKSIFPELNWLYRSTIPHGSSWHFIFAYIYKNCSTISWSESNYLKIIEALKSWTANNKNGDTTRLAGLIALSIYDIQNMRYDLDDLKNKLFDVILSSALEIKDELSIKLKKIIETKHVDRRVDFYDVCEYFLQDCFNNANLCEAVPDLVIQCANKLWKLDNEPTDSLKSYSRSIDINGYFGLEDTYGEYYPTSAFKTPTLTLLHIEPTKALAFVIDFINYTTQCYYESSWKNECITFRFIFEDGSYVDQIASQRIWQAYRGTSVTPHIFSSILMALERWLLMFAELGHYEELNNICIMIIRNSKSVALASVVTSLVIAYPKELFNIACILLSEIRISSFDIGRLVNEISSNFTLGSIPRNQIFDNERINTNNKEFRKKRFDFIIQGYQLINDGLDIDTFNEQRQKIFSILDSVENNISLEDEDSLLSLYRVDVRKQKIDQDSVIEKDGSVKFSVKLDLPIDLQSKIDTRQEAIKDDNNQIELYNWSHSRSTNTVNQEGEYYLCYDNEPLNAYEQMITMYNKEDKSYIDNITIIMVAFVLYRDYKEEIEIDQYHECERILLENVASLINNLMHDNKYETMLSFIPMHFSKKNLSTVISLDNPFIAILSIMLSKGYSDENFIKCYDKINVITPEIAIKLLKAYCLLKKDYDDNVRNLDLLEFLIKHKKTVENIILNVSTELSVNDFKGMDLKQLLISCNYLSCNNTLFVEVICEFGTLIWGSVFGSDRYRYRELYDVFESFIRRFTNNLYFAYNHDRAELLDVLISNLQISDYVERILSRLIFIQDRNKNSDVFWSIWKSFYSKFNEICFSYADMYKDNLPYSYSKLSELDNIIITYSFAFDLWSEDIKSWFTIEHDNLSFFQDISNDMGYNPIVLYSISRVLNTVGYEFVTEGLEWIYIIIHNNPHLANLNLQINTVYYLEEYIFRYISTKQENIKKSKTIKDKVLCILDFLVEKGSIMAYKLRENLI